MEGIIHQGRTQCLLVGNGINLLFKDPSWEDMIKQELSESKSILNYEEIKEMPATMQIVAATNDQVDRRMKDISRELLKTTMTEKRTAFLQSLLDLPVDDILTTNYAYELEMAGGMKPDKKYYSAKLQSTFLLQEKHRHFRLFQYYALKNKRIWHVHGDIAKPETMLMGHYYYAKQLRAIQDCTAKAIQRYNINVRQGEPFTAYSWVEQFLTGDVYILGLGMYLCESDMWYLLCCKKRNFPEAKTVFYDNECKDKNIIIMLKTYGVEIVSGQDLRAQSDYDTFYREAVIDIRRRIIEHIQPHGGKTV